MTRHLTITYYDFCDILTSGFYISGLRANSTKYGYCFHISKRMPALFRGLKLDYGTFTRYELPLVFRFESGTDDYYFCIDWADSSLSYSIPLLQRVRYYFKIEYDKLDVANAFDVNYNPDVVNQEEHAHKIISILPGIPLLENGIMNRVPRLTPCRQMRWDSRSAVKRIRALSRLYDLHTLRLLRDTAKSHDVYFVTTYYSGPTHAALVEFRYKVMEELLKQGSHETVCGFAARDELPKPFNKYALPRSSRYDYLSRLAGSRVAIYVRGCWDSVSFKFGEYLALGLPVVGQTIARRWEKLDTIPFVADQFAFDAPREIAEEAFRMVQQSEKRRLLGEANAAVFDSLLTPEAVISDVLERLGLPTRSEDPRTKPRE